jgi:hypothetical protein
VPEPAGRGQALPRVNQRRHAALIDEKPIHGISMTYDCR